MNQPNEIWIADSIENVTFQHGSIGMYNLKYISEPFVNELLEAKNTEIAKLKSKIEELTSDPKKQPPTLEEFMAYAKTLQPYRTELNFSLEAKYEAWMDNKWKDGFNKPIKNWKSKLKNTITLLKPTFQNNTSQQQHKPMPSFKPLKDPLF